MQLATSLQPCVLSGPAVYAGAYSSKFCDVTHCPAVVSMHTEATKKIRTSQIKFLSCHHFEPSQSIEHFTIHNLSLSGQLYCNTSVRIMQPYITSLSIVHAIFASARKESLGLKKTSSIP